MKMHVRENLAIQEPEPPAEGWRRWCCFSEDHRKCIIYGIALATCLCVAVGFAVYNIALCPTSHVIQTVCTPPSNGTSREEGLNVTDANSRQERKLDTDVRLPRSVVPISYDIRLIPFLIEDNFTFHGEVKIRAKIIQDCFNITLHAADLDIHRDDIVVRLIDPNSKLERVLQTSRHEVEESKQFFILHFHTTLRKDSVYEISIKYKGYLLDYLQGFYRSSYVENNEKRWIASTQFQPTDARRAFPCFDEPAMKAKFNITIGRPKNMTSISNMPKVAGASKEISYLPDYVWDVFEESVPMSTYLVAFVISDFQNRTNGNFSIWARNDGISAAEYALEVGPKILKFLEEFFGIPFPLPKIDMIALPDFHAGAMENWGLITFRETAMLYQPGVSASGIKQRVATVVAHELAHQWFGNLVTPSWWSDIWLNEGFASYMEYLGVDAIEPQWTPMDQFVINELQNVFTLDALSSSHKISVEVGNPDEINEIFDRISYGKGATIIRMMSHFLTSDVFRRGLRNYLTKMSYDSAEQDHLWLFLTQEAHNARILEKAMTVKEIMDTWTLQTGFPLVTITRDAEKGSLILTQKRFSYEALPPSNESDPLWWIPLTYTTAEKLNFNDTRPMFWMRKNQTIKIEDVDLFKSNWFLFNVQQTGYYRVQYDQQNWQAIITHLRDPARFKQIAAANRAQLIDDSLNLARAGLLSYETALDITLYLEHEDDYVPWKAAVTALNFIDSMFIKEGEYHLWQQYLIRLLKPAYDEVGFDEKGDDSNLLNIYKRVDILTSACHLGYKNCIHTCNRQFRIWMDSPNPDTQNPISPNLKNIVYCNAIRYGTEEEWDFAFERFTKTKVSSERELILSALGCSREAWVLNRYLKRALNESSMIRKQDVFRVFAAVAGNVIGQPIAFSFVRRHWQEMKKYLGSSVTNLNLIIKYSTQRMNSQFELDELKHFIDNHYKEAGLSIQQAVERVEVDLAWMNKNYKSIVEWLRKEVGDGQEQGQRQ